MGSGEKWVDWSKNNYINLFLGLMKIGLATTPY